MAYPALRQMAERNRARFGREVGPAQPYLSGGNGAGGDLKSAALRFLHERCEGLRFSDETAAQEAADGQYRGTSFLPNQIPYNMEMDLDRLCLERELERFIDSGAAQDAYTVYYCYLHMFFGAYGRSAKMIELLSEWHRTDMKKAQKY